MTTAVHRVRSGPTRARLQLDARSGAGRPCLVAAAVAAGRATMTGSPIDEATRARSRASCRQQVDRRCRASRRRPTSSAARSNRRSLLATRKFATAVPSVSRRRFDVGDQRCRRRSRGSRTSCALSSRRAVRSRRDSSVRRTRPVGAETGVANCGQPSGDVDNCGRRRRIAGSDGAMCVRGEKSRRTVGTKKWAPAVGGGPLLYGLNVGGDLLSHTLASAVPSALEGLASGFGMGPGVPPPPQPPTTLSNLSTEHIDHARAQPSHAMVWLCAQGHTVDANIRLLWASPRPISTSQLHPSQGFHLWPINPMVC